LKTENREIPGSRREILAIFQDIPARCSRSGTGSQEDGEEREKKNDGKANEDPRGVRSIECLLEERAEQPIIWFGAWTTNTYFQIR
jgi:hypothetical protein